MISARSHVIWTRTNHIIDCDVTPFLPKDWLEVMTHQKNGQFKWIASEICLCYSKLQKTEGILGTKLRQKLAKKPIMNANVLDYLLANQHLIPDRWKEETNGNTISVFFWGTIYRDWEGELCVRCLRWRNAAWHWNCNWLDRHWFDGSPAAVQQPTD
jgi:hypothetical protein